MQADLTTYIRRQCPDISTERLDMLEVHIKLKWPAQCDEVEVSLCMYRLNGITHQYVSPGTPSIFYSYK